MADGGKVVVKIDGDTSGFSKAINGIGSLTKASVGVAIGAIGAMSTAVVGLGTIAFNYNKEIESYTTNFGVMLGDVQAGVDKVEELKVMAASTPFELGDLAGATEQLIAFGIQSDETQTYLQQLGDISLGSTDKLNTLVNAFGKMNSTGKVTLETINMMAEQGFNPLQEISRTTGESMESLYDRVSAGEVSLEEITKAFETATTAGGQFEGGMEAASKTTEGLISTLSDNAKALLGEVYKPITDGILQTVLPSAIDGIQQLTDAFRNDGIEGLIEVGGDLLGNLIAGVTQQLPNVSNIAINIVSSLVDSLTKNAPAIASAAVGLASNLADGILKIVPQLLQLGFNLVISLADGIAQEAPTLIPEVVQTIIDLILTTLENVPLLIEAGLALLMGLVEGVMEALPVLIEALPVVIEAIVDALILAVPMILEFAPQIINALIQGIITAIPLLIEALPQVITAIINGLIIALPMLIENGFIIINALIQGLIQALPLLVTIGPQIVVQIISGLVSALPQLLATAPQIITTIVSGVTAYLGQLVTLANTMVSSLIDALKIKVNGFMQIGTDIVNGVRQGISNAWGDLVGWFSGLFGDLTGIAESILGINSPSKEFEERVGRWIPPGVARGIDKNKNVIKKSLANMIDVKALQSITAMPYKGLAGHSRSGNSTSNTYHNDNRTNVTLTQKEYTPGEAYTRMILHSHRKVLV